MDFFNCSVKFLKQIRLKLPNHVYLVFLSLKVKLFHLFLWVLFLDNLYLLHYLGDSLPVRVLLVLELQLVLLELLWRLVIDRSVPQSQLNQFVFAEVPAVAQFTQNFVNSIIGMRAHVNFVFGGLHG